MRQALQNIRKICKEAMRAIDEVESNSNGKMIDNDIIMSYKAGAFEKIVTEIRKLAKRMKS